MKKILRYVISRTLSGFVLSFPIAITIFLMGKVLATLRDLNAKLAASVPTETIGMIPVVTLISIASLLLIFFLLGALWAPRRKASSSWLETRFLNFVPGYSLLRGTIVGAFGVQGEEGPRAGVLRRTPGVEELVLILDELADGRSVVFLPRAPTPISGELIIVKSELVEPIEASIMDSLRVFTDWGKGAAKVLPPVRLQGS